MIAIQSHSHCVLTGPARTTGRRAGASTFQYIHFPALLLGVVRSGLVNSAVGGDRSVSEGLAWLNALPRDDAERELHACCAARAWVSVVAAGRPYPTVAALAAAGAAAL